MSGRLLRGEGKLFPGGKGFPVRKAAVRATGTEGTLQGGQVVRRRRDVPGPQALRMQPSGLSAPDEGTRLRAIRRPIGKGEKIRKGMFRMKPVRWLALWAAAVMVFFLPWASSADTRRDIMPDADPHTSGIFGVNNMETWFVDNFQNHETYWSFLAYIGAHSDAFSLIYFQYDQGEKPSQTVLAVKDALAPYLIEEKEVTRWPGTETRNENCHIYCMRTYRVSFDSLEALEAADSLWDWDYPEYPMDLCFYRRGYAWFASSVHEHWNALYTDEPRMIRDLSSVGLQVSLTGETDRKDIFFDESLKDVRQNLSFE